MPLPTPTPGQPRDAFLAACMAAPTMLAEYPDEPQRFAVCLAQWDSSRREPAPLTRDGWPVTPFLVGA